MSRPDSRRGFLRGLTTLPLIGGSVALISTPSAVAEPVTRDMLDSYDAWLFYERRFFRFERYGTADGDLGYDGRFVIADTVTGKNFDYVSLANAGGRFHGPDTAPATSRAALVLSAVGCGWEGL